MKGCMKHHQKPLVSINNRVMQAKCMVLIKQKMKSAAFIVIFTLLSLGENFGQTEGCTTYKLKVVEDVTLEKGSTNFNYLEYLITSFHPGFPKKRSLLRFENVPSGCKSINYARMYLYYVYSHKASYQSDAQAPFITRTIQAHRVLKPWKESEATSTKRDSYNYWQTQWLGLNNIDATSSYTGQVTIRRDTPRGFVSIDVTSAAKAWKSGSSNYGVVIWATNEDQPGRDTRFASNARRDSSQHAYISLNCDNTITKGGGAPPNGGGALPPGGRDIKPVREFAGFE